MGPIKFLTYESAKGPRAGIAAGEHVFDLAELTGDPGDSDMLGVLSAWDRSLQAASAAIAKAVDRGRPLAEARLLPSVHIRTHSFDTVVGPITYKNGEWSKPRMVFTQFQNITGNGLDQFHDAKRQVILWPAESKTGNMIYPYVGAGRKK